MEGSFSGIEGFAEGGGAGSGRRRTVEHEDSEGGFGAQGSLGRGRHRRRAFSCVDKD